METRKKVVLVIFLFLILFVLGSVTYINSLLDKIDHDTEPIADSDPGISADVEKNPGQSHDKIISIALFGIDYVNGDKGRSDTIIILSIDKTNNILKLTSIMRDSFVAINGHGKDKINHAYAFGGPQLAVKTLNENFNLNITKYVTVNFTDFSTIIDRLGGIKITVTDEEAREIPNLEKGGTYNLTGDQALAYSRIRCLDGGDYERTLRQRILLENLYSMLINRPIVQNIAVVDELLPAIKTNLTNGEIMTFCTYIATYRPRLEHTRFPKDDASSGECINGVYYLVFQEQETANAMHKFIFEPIS